LDEILEILKGFLWVGILHEEPAKRLLRNAMIMKEILMTC
jgi:hypothetical protein